MEIYERVRKVADLYLTTSLSMRSIGQMLGVGKSTIFDDLHKRLPSIDPGKTKEVKSMANIKKVRRGSQRLWKG